MEWLGVKKMGSDQEPGEPKGTRSTVLLNIGDHFAQDTFIFTFR